MSELRHEHDTATTDTATTDMAALLADATAAGGVAGRYELHRLLGSGGVADVHEATDSRLDRAVAVKLLREATASETDRARFLAEARLLARLSHPRLVRVLDAGVDRDRPFLVLELVRGSTLADALGEPLPPARVAQLGADIASALDHVHTAGVIHRDVKPGNVLIDADGTAMLADFGIARLVDDTRHHTRTGHVVGTVAYLAPEQVAGEPVTTAVDVYALGLVLLEALTGARPYTGTSVEMAFARLSHAPEIPTTLPVPWRELLAAMTARDPRDRPTAAQVAMRLRGGPGPVAVAPARPGVSPRLALSGAAIAFALLLGTAGWTSLSVPAGVASAASVHRAHLTPAPPHGAVRTPVPESVVGPATTPVVAPPAPAAQPAATPRHHHARHLKHHPRHHHHHRHRKHRR
jgi:tRNA A-37 threonylcarbamoyl transferase component Bud32